MKTFQIELEPNCTKETIEKIITEIFSNDVYIYALIPHYYDDFMKELSKNFKIIKEVLDSKYSFPPTNYSLGYIEDDAISWIYEFFERSASIPFVITDKKIQLSFSKVNRENFYKFYTNNNIQHIQVGPDKEFLTVCKNN
jgi:hypothetical protein